MKAKTQLVLFVTVLMVLPAMADAGDWIIRGRLISVSPNDSSSTIGDTGTAVAVDDDIVPELDITYMFNQNWGLEVIAATSTHSLAGQGGALGGADIGEVAALPPTFSLQYHTGYPEAFDLYFGIGLNYTLFYDYDLSDDLAGLGVSDLDFDDSIGISGQVGLDISISDHWVINLDAKYITISTDVDIELEGGGILDTVSVDIDPWVWGVGLGYRF
ncbi:MAG: OmpW family outer membrane protein [Acidobacteriota bacterium]